MKKTFSLLFSLLSFVSLGDDLGPTTELNDVPGTSTLREMFKAGGGDGSATTNDLRDATNLFNRIKRDKDDLAVYEKVGVGDDWVWTSDDPDLLNALETNGIKPKRVDDDIVGYHFWYTSSDFGDWSHAGEWDPSYGVDAHIVQFKYENPVLSKFDVTAAATRSYKLDPVSPADSLAKVSQIPTEDEKAEWNAKQEALSSSQLANIAEVPNKRGKTDMKTATWIAGAGAPDDLTGQPYFDSDVEYWKWNYGNIFFRSMGGEGPDAEGPLEFFSYDSEETFTATRDEITTRGYVDGKVSDAVSANNPAFVSAVQNTPTSGMPEDMPTDWGAFGTVGAALAALAAGLKWCKNILGTLASSYSTFAEWIASKLDRSSLLTEYSPSYAYSVGAIVYHDGNIYQCKTAIAEGGEAWNAEHWELRKLDDFFTESNSLLTGTIDAEVISKGTAPDAHLEAPTDEHLKLVRADNSVAYDSAKALPYKLTPDIGDRVVATMTLTAASTDITLPAIAANDTTVKDFILDVTNAYAVEGVATDAGINIPRTDFKLVTRDGESLTDVTTVKAGKSAFICFTQKSPVVVDGTTYPCWCVIQLPFGDPS